MLRDTLLKIAIVASLVFVLVNCEHKSNKSAANRNIPTDAGHPKPEGGDLDSREHALVESLKHCYENWLELNFRQEETEDISNLDAIRLGILANDCFGAMSVKDLETVNTAYRLYKRGFSPDWSGLAKTILPGE